MRSLAWIGASVIVLAACGASDDEGTSAPAGEQASAQSGGVEVQGPEHFDVSPPLRTIPPKPRGAGRKLHELRPVSDLAGGIDTAVQPKAGATLPATLGLSFAGVGDGDYGFSPDAAPPDTNGAVGATQYVQWVNESFAVFDKSTGARVQGPTTGNTLWSGFGGACEADNDGDPIVQYDEIANRWILTQFAVSSTPYLQCVAVSRTADATGEYNRYSYAFNRSFNDYPKLGVWPDAYYMTFNMFKGSSFAGPRLCALDRAAMLAGAAATMQCFQLGRAYGSVLPGDLDMASPAPGTTPTSPPMPPVGEPNPMVAFGSSVLNLWSMHVDWTKPSNSTLTGPTALAVPAFTPTCPRGACVPQARTAQRLDALSDRLMYRLAYRNFAGHASLVVNHSVQRSGGGGGVRWYELTKTGGGAWTVAQASTYAPDAAYRWMGSVAMDRSGNMALGYSVSSSAMSPQIRITGRLHADTAGTLRDELAVGPTSNGSQVGGLNRWGDYSSMSLDPVDDCTFWYTQEYLKEDGAFNWSTRVVSFKLQGCAP